MDRCPFHTDETLGAGIGHWMMFNLETAISTWKRSLELNRSFRKDDIEELERHVRDVVQYGISNGQTE